MSAVQGKMLRGEINGILGEYTSHGWMLDYGCCSARAVIIDTGEIGNELRKLRNGKAVNLKLVVEGECKQTTVEYDGPAEVQMVRFRASRKELPHFRTQFKLRGLLGECVEKEVLNAETQ